MAGLACSDNGHMPVSRPRRNSYFEALSSVSSDLNFVASDLKKAQVSFKASSPKSPLAVTASVPLAAGMLDNRLQQTPPVDRYQHLRFAGNFSPATNNNASTLSTIPSPHYVQLSPSARNRNSASLPRSLESLFLPASAQPSRASFHEGLINPHQPPSHFGDNSIELSLMTRLVHTKLIWFLPNTQRTAAIHYLQGQPVGTFVVCQARDKDNIVLTMKHPGKGTGLYIEKLPIVIDKNGVKLSNATEEFSTIEDLILHHLYHEGTLPCKLALPPDILAAGNIRALQSLALFEEEFWLRNQSRPGVAEKQAEVPRDFPGPVELSRSWSTFPPPSAKQHEIQSSCLTSSSMAPSLPSPKGYMIMKKLPVTAAQTPVAATNAGATVKLDSGGQGLPSVSRQYRNVDRVAAQNRQLHKSWSFDDKNNPYRQSEFMSMIPARGVQRESHDDTLLASTGRQPIRCSTQSQQEFLLKNLGHYPPPLHSPPPPPEDSANAARSPHHHVVPPLIHRGSAEYYYRPFESTRQGHHPPSAFGFESMLPGLKQPTPLPPPLPHRSASHPLQGLHYQQPMAASLLPSDFPQYSSPASHPVPQGSESEFSILETQLASLKRTCLPEPEVPQRPTFGSINTAQHDLAPILKPSVSLTPPPLSPEQVNNPLLEFDPLLASSQCKETASSASFLSQDVFSEMPKQSPVSAESQSQHLKGRYETTIGQLLDLAIESSEDEEKESRETKLTKSEGETQDYSSEDWDQTGDDEEDEDEDEEGDRTRGDRSSSTADTQSSHSSEAQTGERTTNDPKMTTFSDEDHDERSSADKLSELTASQTKKIKKLKKKKMSNLSRIQKYVLRSKAKKKKHKGDPAEEIQAAIHKLASNKSSYFSMMMECFVQNIKDKEEKERPDVLIRNLRQFMSGMKNYLFNRREPEVDAAMDKYHDLTMAELDAIVESAIHSYILLPLKSEIYKCYVNDHKESGALDALDHNMQLARARTPIELGIKKNYTPPDGKNLERIRQCFHQLEEAYSPIKKLEHLLDIVRTVYDTVVDQNSGRGQAVQSMGADDFLPMFIYVLVQCEVVHIEIEADYMWGLLEPTMLSGEGGYYLTTLSSAICVLKQFEQENLYTETKGFLSVMVAMGDTEDPVVHKTLPVLPGMNAGDVSRILAHKMKIDNAHLYRLYLITGEEEIPIGDNECPLQMKENEAGGTRPCFGYKIENRPVKWFPVALHS